MKSGVGFLAFRLCRWASVLLVILLSLLVVSCDLWNKDMLGYLEHWSETVQLGKVEVSDATIQKNDSGVDTISLSATPTIAAYVINPKSYELLAEIGDSSSSDRSVRISSQSVQTKAQVVAHEATLLKIQLGSADGSLEHTEFRVDFEAIRKDTMQSSRQVMGVTLQYNTPPVAPTPVVWNYDSNQYEVVKAGEKWEADRGGILYWAYDDSITKETDPNCAKWFSIGGTRHPVADCKVKPNVQVDSLSIFQFNTNYGGTSVAALDAEGVASPTITSGQAVPPATYVIKYDGNGATGGTAPTSQSKTQYTDITLATNSGGLARTGYTFAGWNTQSDGQGNNYAAGAVYTDDASVTLHAQWTANTYTVQFEGNGSNSGRMDTQQFTYDQLQSLTNNQFTRIDHEFVGWNTVANGTGDSYENGQSVSNLTADPNGSVTLYAQWAALVSGSGGASSDAVNYIKNLASAAPGIYTVKVTDSLSPSDVPTIREALIAAGDKVKVRLDLSSVTGLTEIPQYAFNSDNGGDGSTRADNLVWIRLPDTVTRIGQCAFDCLLELKYVDLGSGVTYIEREVFDYCYALSTIRVSANPPPTWGNSSPFRLQVDTMVFSKRTIEVPPGSLAAYQGSAWANIQGGGQYATIVEY